jgi:hypothetical protein
LVAAGAFHTFYCCFVSWVFVVLSDFVFADESAGGGDNEAADLCRPGTAAATNPNVIINHYIDMVFCHILQEWPEDVAAQQQIRAD